MLVSNVRIALALLVSSLVLASASGCKSEKADEAATSDSAEPIASGDHPRGKHQLPPAAFDACQGKGVGDECTVTFGQKQITAKCAAAPDGRLACRPEHSDHKKPE